MLSFFGGCARNESTSESGGKPSETSLIPLRVVVAENDQTAVTFPSLPVFGCPAHEVRRLLRQAEQDYAADQQRLQAVLDSRQAARAKAKGELERERQALSKNYNDAVPRGEHEVLKMRNPLAGLSQARAAKSEQDQRYEIDLGLRIAPLEERLEQAEEAVDSAQADLAQLRKSLSDRLFEVLPTKPDRLWKTDKEGRVTLALERNEPWYVWASGTRQVSTRSVVKGKQQLDGSFVATVTKGGFETKPYRWLRLIPDDVDSSGELTLDGSNLFDGTVHVQSLGDVDGDSPHISR